MGRDAETAGGDATSFDLDSDRRTEGGAGGGSTQGVKARIRKMLELGLHKDTCEEEARQALIYMYMYVCMYIRMCMYVHTCYVLIKPPMPYITSIHTYVCTYVFMYVCMMHVCMYVCVYDTYVYTYYMHTHACTHARTHTHTHTHTHTQALTNAMRLLTKHNLKHADVLLNASAVDAGELKGRNNK